MPSPLQPMERGGAQLHGQNDRIGQWRREMCCSFKANQNFVIGFISRHHLALRYLLGVCGLTHFLLISVNCKGSLKNEVKQDVSCLPLHTKAIPGIDITKEYSIILIFIAVKKKKKKVHPFLKAFIEIVYLRRFWESSLLSKLSLKRSSSQIRSRRKIKVTGA